MKTLTLFTLRAFLTFAATEQAQPDRTDPLLLFCESELAKRDLLMDEYNVQKPDQLMCVGHASQTPQKTIGLVFHAGAETPIVVELPSE